jgi:phage baseplate assembly protein gpV
MDLEGLRAILSDKRNHIAIGKVVKLSIASDRSFVKCLVSIWPEQREIVTHMTWDSVGGESGFFVLPSPGDMVLVAFADGDEEQAFVIRRLTSKEDKLPLRAADGDSVVVSMAGKKTWITSDTRVNLSAGTEEPTEPVPLGIVLRTALSAMLAELKAYCDTMASHTHICAPAGVASQPPKQASAITGHGSALEAIKNSPVDDNAMNSDLTFTEKGGA